MKRKFIHLILAFAASCMSLFAQGVTVTLTTEMILPGFGGFELPFDVSVTKSGLSRMYWK